MSFKPDTNATIGPLQIIRGHEKSGQKQPEATSEAGCRSCLPAKNRAMQQRQIAVKVMRLCLDYWIETTNSSKIEMARRVGIWKLYTDHKGYVRTQTLDKYLNEQTMPKRPHLNWINHTAIFVLSHCTLDSSLREQLEQARRQLKSQNYNKILDT